MIPKIDLPTWDLTVPSGKEVTIRPFLVKEEKILLIAAESGDQEEIIRAALQIINSCVMTPGFEVSELPFFDVDYLFIALRAKSIGDSIDIRFTCNNEVSGKKCGTVFPANIDISRIGVRKIEIPNPVVIGPSLSVKMKYPSYVDMMRIGDSEDDLTQKSKIIARSIHSIISGESVTESKDMTPGELEEFVESLTKAQWLALQVWVDNFPSFFIETEATCPSCKFVHHIEYTDFTSFFE